MFTSTAAQDTLPLRNRDRGLAGHQYASSGSVIKAKIDMD